MKQNINSELKTNDLIKTVEGRATARCLDYTRLTTAVEDAEEKLSRLGIPKKYWIGVTVTSEPAAVCNSYNKGYGAQGTFGTLERFATGWFVVNVWRGYTGSVSGGRSERDKMMLSETASKNIPSEYII